MIEWLSTHDESDALTGAVLRVRVGKGDQAFWDEWKEDKEKLKSQGYSVFEAGKDGWFVKQLGRSIVEPPCANIPCPRPPSFLWDWQRKHFKDGMWPTFSAKTSALDGSDTGTGKTITSIAFSLEQNKRIFVVCPMNAIATWKREIKKYRVPFLCVGNYEHFKGDNDFGVMNVVYHPGKIFHAIMVATGKEGNATMPPFPKWQGFKDYKESLEFLFSKTILTPKILADFEEKLNKSFRIVSRKINGYTWKLPKDTLVIFDEVHRCKAHDSQNMRLLVAAKPYVTLALSATPAVTPRDFRALGYSLGMHRLYDFDMWTRDHGCKQNHWKGWDYLPTSKGMEKLSTEIYPAHGFRMRISEIPGFPETQITAEEFECKEAPALMKAYAECVKECEGAVKKKSMLVISSILKYRQKAEWLKIPLFISLIEEALEGGFSVPMFVNFLPTLQKLKEHFTTAPLVHGGQTGKKGALEREEGKLAFQANKERVIILMTQAGGESIDLHDVHGGHPRMSIISPTYNGFHLKQVFGRVRRGGGKSKSLQRLIYMSGTVEGDVCKKVREKLQSFDTLHGELAPETLMEDRLCPLQPDLKLLSLEPSHQVEEPESLLPD